MIDHFSIELSVYRVIADFLTDVAHFTCLTRTCLVFAKHRPLWELRFFINGSFSLAVFMFYYDSGILNYN